MKNENQIYLNGEQGPIETKFVLENPRYILPLFGLSENQAKVYLYLNKSGSKTASRLSKNLDIPRTEIYAILKILKKKGCVTTKNEKPMKFNSVPFEKFLESIINLKKNEIKKLEETLSVINALKSSKFQPNWNQYLSSFLTT